MRILIIIFVVTFKIPNCFLAQTFNSNLSVALQNTLDSFQTTYNLKGISASVYIPIQGHWQGVTGVSHTGVPITPETCFGIASNTKLFTGVLVLKLAENGLLSLDDSLHQYLPNFNNIDSNITIRQLLNHTSGLSDVNIPGYADSMLKDPNRIFTPTEIISWVGPPLSAPGEQWYYCNTNYLLAGLIAESVGQTNFSQLLRNNILNPLQLDSTYLAVYESLPLFIAHPWQGGLDFSATPRTSINSAAWSAGAMYSNSSELVQWYKSLMNGEIINQNSLAEMTTFVGSGSYGIGISKVTINGRIIWQHGGTIWGGYNSFMMYDVESGSVICVLINQLPAQAFQVAIKLLDAIAPYTIANVDVNDALSLEIFPNPAHDNLQVDIKKSGHISYKITSNSGIKLLEGTLTQVENVVSLSDLHNGVYFITLKDNDRQATYKLIKN